MFANANSYLEKTSHFLHRFPRHLLRNHPEGCSVIGSLLRTEDSVNFLLIQAIPSSFFLILTKISW